MLKENKRQQNMLRTQRRESVQSKLNLIHQKAKEDKKMKFTSLLHHIYNIDMLRLSYLELKRNAAPGVDKETWESYGKDLEENLKDLSVRLRKGAYRAKPVKRAFISGSPLPSSHLGFDVVELPSNFSGSDCNTICSLFTEGGAIFSKSIKKLFRSFWS